MTRPSSLRNFFVNFGGAIVIVGIGAGIRFFFFSGLDRGIPYLTFYPAVMVAALYGGFSGGALATLISALLCFFWIQRGYMSRVETLAMSMFCISCTMICFIAEAMIRAEKKASEAKTVAEAANRAKSIFLANMSHELRTPLNAILGFSSLMRTDAALSKKHLETLDIINRSGTYLLGLINDVLDFAKIEAGRATVANTAFNLKTLAEDVSVLIRQRAESKGLLLTLEFDNSVPQYIISDAPRLRQILVNLLGNAVKFTRQGTILLRFAGRNKGDDDQHLLTVEVTDTGIGIPPAAQRKIFEPFFQLSDSADQKGTGLGLSITRNLVDLLGGTISVRSIPGTGSTFSVELPVKTSPAETGQAPMPDTYAALPHLSAEISELRVLIADDQDENRELLKQLLEQAGCSVRTAHNGAEGIAACKEWNPHFIWMDLRMPVMDGIETTRRIRASQQTTDVKIAILSASVFQEDREKVLAAGADDFVTKPITFNKIFESMNLHLGGHFFVNGLPLQPKSANAGSTGFRDLSLLPASLSADLKDALTSLDTERLDAITRRISETNGDLAAELDEHLHSYRYSDLLRVLE